jgi:hypothetical protein
MWRIRCWGSARQLRERLDVTFQSFAAQWDLDELPANRSSSSKVKSSQNLRVLRTNPASCLPMSNRRVGVGDHLTGTQRTDDTELGERIAL